MLLQSIRNWKTAGFSSVWGALVGPPRGGNRMARVIWYRRVERLAAAKRISFNRVE
jgi:hypothetical protein